MYKKQVCVCEKNRRICIVLDSGRNASGTGHTRFVLPDFVYDPVRCSGILPVLLLKIEKSTKKYQITLAILATVC